MKSPVILSLALTSLMLLTHCASSNKGDFSTKVPDSELSHAQAVQRYNQVSDVKYTLDFTLTKEKATYKGTTTIDFSWKGSSDDLRVDFSKGKIVSFEVNDKAAQANYNGHFITVPSGSLKKGPNSLTISFEKDFSKNGDGLYRFQDPEDNRVYTYTNLEPFDANRVFPSFDQPDLKATYKMTVTAPKDWTVITSVREISATPNGAQSKVWTFPESAKFSTYIWSLHAGPYHVWKDNYDEIPLRLFSRQSLKKYVKPKDWFQFTKNGLKYYEDYFAYPYPYKKYDQILVPDFNPGAMENVGAVTFNEFLVRRGVRSEEHRRILANIILHEMAHMWFGDLVTMKWWNGLWLNESFATYMAAKASSETTEFGEKVWRDFSGRKERAYYEDQLVTTHPIEVPVHSTGQAFANFDSITYGKGASWLKQVAFYVGPDKFREGMRWYFKRYAESNTEIDDFVGALSKASGKDLTQWSQEWLTTAGVNTLATQIKCNDGRVESLSLLQSASEKHPQLRQQKTRIAFFHKSGNQIKLNETLTVEFSGKTTDISMAKGRACPDLVLANYGSEAYLKLALDERSLETVKNHIDRIQNPESRRMLWATLWSMVQDGGFNIETFGTMALKGVQKERDDLVLKHLLSVMHGRFSNSPSLLFYWPQKTAEEKRSYMKFITQLEKMTWRRLALAKSRSEAQKILFDGFSRIVETEFGLGKVYALLNGKARLPGFKVDQDKRWKLLLTLSQHNFKNVTELIEQEKVRDPSNFGKKMAIACEAALPINKFKNKWSKEIKNPKRSLAELEMVSYNLFPRSQRDLRAAYESEFATNLKTFVTQKDSLFLNAYSALGPDPCQAGSGQMLGQLIDEVSSKAPPILIKKLKIRQQESQFCQRIHQVVQRETRGVASK